MEVLHMIGDACQVYTVVPEVYFVRDVAACISLYMTLRQFTRTHIGISIHNTLFVSVYSLVARLINICCGQETVVANITSHEESEWSNNTH